MRRAHAMPFGAEMAGGETRFRLWAPGCSQVGLQVGKDSQQPLAMSARDGGWHETSVKGLTAGTPYAFVIGDGRRVPDPASRSNPDDVNGPSALVDPHAFEWTDGKWRGRPWHEAVVYELHVGTFTAEGTFAAAIGKLDHLAGTGVTAIELMPLADFAGARNWGYDGVLHFAPDAAYGTPEDLKRLVVEAHRRGLMVLLDVVYNHFGPEGNHIAQYAPQFFNAAHKTPWGDAINFDGEHARTVRDFFVHNALYWIEEFHLDGLRLDAVHAIADESPTHIATEIAAAIAAGPGRARHVHLVLENDRNQARLLDSGSGVPNATAQWNDDWHHAAHVLTSGEKDGYYEDYAGGPAWMLARALAEGFAYQGEASRHRLGEPRGEPSGHLPLQAFIAFLQNHDQVGNRALGERLLALAPGEAVRLAAATLLLAPSVPMLFMGEELGTRAPFLYFCDYRGDLAKAVTEGRRKEFAAFARFRDPAARERIPDPNDPATFMASKLPWGEADGEWLGFYRALLALRREYVVPRLAGRHRGATFATAGATGVAVDWTLGDGSRLHLRANFGGVACDIERAPGAILHTEGDCLPSSRTEAEAVEGLPPWGGIWSLEPA